MVVSLRLFASIVNFISVQLVRAVGEMGTDKELSPKDMRFGSSGSG